MNQCLVYLLGASLLSITAQGNIYGGECVDYSGCVCEVSLKTAPDLSFAWHASFKCHDSM